MPSRVRRYVPHGSEAGAGVSEENAQLDQARAVVRARLQALAGSGPQATREIIGAHLELLDDPELIGNARIAITNGKSQMQASRKSPFVTDRFITGEFACFSPNKRTPLYKRLPKASLESGRRAAGESIASGRICRFRLSNSPHLN